MSAPAPRRPRRRPPGYGRSVAFLVATIAVAGTFFVGFLALSGALPSFGSTYEVGAVVPNAGTVFKGTRVTMAGVSVGRVTQVQRRGYGAYVKMRFTDKRVTPLPADSHFELRQRTPIGENYVSVVRGKATSTLGSGAVLPMSQAEPTVDVDQILSTLQGGTRNRARAMLQGLGGALDGRGAQLNDLVGGVGGFFTYGPPAVATLSSQPQNVKRLVLQLGDIASSLADRDRAIAAVGTNGLRALRAVETRDAALRAILPRLKPTLDQVATTSGTLSAVSHQATGVADDLAAALREIRPSVRSLGPASTQGQAVVEELGRATPALRPALGSLRAASKPVSAALPAVRGVFCQLNPALDYLKPYTQDVMQTVAGLGSASNAYDAIGHTVRVGLTVSDDTLVGLPDGVSKAAYQLLHAGLLGKTSGLTYHPYPEPGSIGAPLADGDRVFSPADVGGSGYRFPHLTAAC